MKPLPLIALAALVVAAVVLTERLSLFAPVPAPTPDETDEQVVKYVFEVMLPAWASTAVEKCHLPSRAIKGVLQVETRGGAVVLSGWRWEVIPSSWPEAARRCMEEDLVGRSSAPSPKQLVVPEGREYAVDIDLVIPLSVSLQQP